MDTPAIRNENVTNPQQFSARKIPSTVGEGRNRHREGEDTPCFSCSETARQGRSKTEHPATPLIRKCGGVYYFVWDFRSVRSLAVVSFISFMMSQSRN